MTSAVALAAVAGACAVLGAWEALGALEQAAPARLATLLVGPLRAAGTAGREPSAGERRRLALVGTGTLLAAGWLLAGPAGGAALAAAGPWSARRVVVVRRRRWRSGVAASAPAVARALADALAGGHSIRDAIGQVARAGGLGPAGDAELRGCAAALELGERTDAVLEQLRRRATHPAYDTLVAALLLQRDAGGALASLLRSVAAELEAARRAEADARAVTAQARFTAGLVAVLPLGAAGLAELAAPGTLLAIASEPLPAMLAAAAVTCQIAAFAAVRRLARVGEGT